MAEPLARAALTREVKMTLAGSHGGIDLAELRPSGLEVTGDLGLAAFDDGPFAFALQSELQRSLGARSSLHVSAEPHGDAGEIVVRITGPRSCLRLSFARDEAEPGYVMGIVRDAVARFGL
jgi:hypothetical protein